MFIDVEQAKEILKNRAANRRLNPQRVVLYARQMRNGTWSLTHQGLSFDCDGRLNDGQHRVAAIVESGIGQWFWVYEESSRATGMAHFDKHQERSTLQSITLAGLPATQLLVSVARSILQDGDYFNTRVTWTDEEIWAVAEANADRVNRIASALGKAKFYGGATFIAACTRALHAWNENACVYRFAEIINNGVVDGEGESAAIRYRDWALQNTRGGGCTVRNQTYYRAVSALDAFRMGRGLLKLYAASKDPFAGCGLPGGAKGQ